MKIEVGPFGRFWDNNKENCVYGYLAGIGEGSLPYRLYKANGTGPIYTHFEPADPQPQWPTRRRVIKDRAKLCRVLLDMGYVPDDEGNFRHYKKLNFYNHMFYACGDPVEINDKRGMSKGSPAFIVENEWTEEY